MIFLPMTWHSGSAWNTSVNRENALALNFASTCVQDENAKSKILNELDLSHQPHMYRQDVVQNENVD
eukprot:SAG31_NODE_21162_length_556_cov_1.122538_1_plen_67_part_00